MPAFKRQDLSDLLPGIDLSKIPSGIPPDGVIPNFIDPENVGYIPRIGIYVLLPLMLAAVLCRIGTRLKLTRTLGLDDVFCIIGTVGLPGPGADLGDPLGKHQWDIPVSQITDEFVRTTFVGVVLQYLAVMFIKVSILVFYLKISERIRWARIAIWTGLAAVLGFYIIINVVLLAICVPRDGHSWVLSSAKHKWQAAALDTALAAGWFGTIADFYILAIPIRLLSTLKLSRKHKFGVMAIFLTGLMWVQISMQFSPWARGRLTPNLVSSACGCSAANLAQRYKLTHHDITYNDTLAYIYIICEINIAIICSCMPAFAAPIRGMTSRVLSSWNTMKKRSETTLPPKESGDELHNLPEIPRGNISGLRTFIRRFDRSESEKTTVMVDMSNFSRLESVEEDYHRQLRAVHGGNTNVSSRPSAPSSRG